MTKKRRGPRGSYKCTRCREYGHRADKCTAPIDLSAEGGMKTELAARAMLAEDFAVHVVIAGAVQDGLMGALQTVGVGGSSIGSAIVNAYRELAARERHIPRDVINRARAAKAKLDAAWSEYATAAAPIRDALKPHTKESP